MKDIIVIGNSTGSTLAIIRSIKKKFKINAYVICLNKSLSQFFLSSKYVNDAIELFSDFHVELFIEIQEWFNKKNFIEKPIIYATNDDACLLIDNHRDWFELNTILSIPSSSIIKTYNFKGFAECDAEKNGLLIPKTIKINTKNDAAKVLNSFNFPLIIKPSSSQSKKIIDFKAKIFDDKSTFQLAIDKLLSEKKSVICQEFIPGEDDQVFYYLFYRNAGGEIFENVGVKILQSPPKNGIMAIGVTAFNKQISSICKSFLKKINYEGIGGIEFKQYNGNYYFIEMSTRPEGFHLISEISGVPLSLISYNDYCNLKINMSYAQEEGIKYINIIPLLEARKLQRKYFFFILEIIAYLFQRKTYFNIIDFSDLKPFLKLVKIRITSRINKKNKLQRD